MISYVPCGRFYPSRSAYSQPGAGRRRTRICRMTEPIRSLATRRARPERRGAPRRVSVVGVLGELLLTAGALVLLFLGWQLWWNDAIMAGQQSAAASDSRRAVDRGGPGRRAATRRRRRRPTTATRSSTRPTYANAERVRGHVRAALRRGLAAPRRRGHRPRRAQQLRARRRPLPGTQMPGQVGNFAIAAHRSAYGGGMHEIEQLQLGDAIYIQTHDGWYTYRFRDLEYVTPDDGGRARTRAAPPRAAADRPHRDAHQLQPAATRPPSASSPTACSSPGSRAVGRSAGRDRRDRRDLGGLSMYGALWRVLPGPVWVRIILLLHPARRRRLRPRSPGSSPGSTPSSTRSKSRWSNDPHPRHRQLRQLRLHAERLPAGARRRDRGGAQRRHRRADVPARIAEYDAVLLSPGPGQARGRRRLDPDRRGRARRRASRCSACASGTRRSPRRSARRSPTPRSSCTARPRSSRTTTATSTTGCRSRSRRRGTTRSRSSTAPCPTSSSSPAAPQGGVIMGLRHETAPIFGVQFHPESVLTEGGYRMLGNWLAVAGLPEARERAVHLTPLMRRELTRFGTPRRLRSARAVGELDRRTAAARRPAPATAG